MGDALTLIEKTRSLYSDEQARKLEEKLLKQTFTLDDFLDQMRQVRKLGSFNDLLKMVPGLSKALPKDFEIPERELSKIEAIICSMTRGERRNPTCLTARAANDRAGFRHAGFRRKPAREAIRSSTPNDETPEPGSAG